MSRKRIADQEPAVTSEGAAAAPAKAPAKRKASEETKARAPRSSANAVTHRHKKTEVPSAPEVYMEETPVETAALQELSVASPAAVMVAEAVAEPVPPSHEDIARLAYLLWEGRGYQGGSQHEDWITAERMLWEQRTAK